MKLIRILVLLMSTLAMFSGYVASQSAFFLGTTQGYSNFIDSSIFPIFFSVLLFGVIVCAFIKVREPE